MFIECYDGTILNSNCIIQLKLIKNTRCKSYDITETVSIYTYSIVAIINEAYLNNSYSGKSNITIIESSNKEEVENRYEEIKRHLNVI